ncbi:MAG: hypothetical protein II859_11755 [Bacteroidales bacterium]|nr:hypothetical protein [Bacteroidales bacterium]
MKKSNKNVLKITLVVVAVILAVGAVLVFMKTRVQPPTRLTYVNQYTANIHQAAESIANADERALETEFQRVTNRIRLMQQESLITNEEYTGSVSEFVNAYVPAFRNWCEQRFNQSAWPGETIRFMRSRINEVNRYNAEGGNSIVSGENATKLGEVNKVLNDYDAAWKLQNVAIHKSDDSKTNLAKARRYKQDSHLSKCTALVNMLNNLPSRYQQLHYNHVNALVRGLSMAHFPAKNQVREWADKYKNAKSAVNDYNSVASSLYHTTTSNFNLDSYYNQAKTGFRNKISVWDPENIRKPYEQTFGVRIN